MDVHSVHDPSPHSSVGTVLPPRQHHSASVSSSLPHGLTIANGGVHHYQIPDNTGGSLMSSSFHHSPSHNQSNNAPISINPQNQPTLTNGGTFDPRNLEIKTRSVEQTLLPLVQQISTLVTFQKESLITGSRPKSERALRAALKIGTAVEAAVERFVAVGETIADENPDIQPELYDACYEARMAGSSIANLHNSLLAEEGQKSGADLPPDHPSPPTVVVDSAQLVRAARQLLSSVTRVLLLADRVLVKHILRAEDKIAYSLTKLEHTANFTEFVQIFTEFGNQMVDLAHRSGDRQQDLKSEKRRAQMQVARAQLERLTMLLLTSSKSLLRHPEDTASRQCRDGVFHQIRSALQLVAVCVTDGVMPFDASVAYPSPLDELSRTRDGPLDIGIQLTASVAIRQLCEMMSLIGMMPLIGSGVRERLVTTLSALCEMSADFTESVWTPIQQREQILDLLEECRFEMGNLVNPPQNNVAGGDEQRLQNGNNEITVERLNRRLKDLRKQLQVVALEQIATVFRQNEDQAILSSLKTCSISGDIDGVERFLEQFRLHAEHLQEVCRLLHHISLTDALHVFTGHAERNLRALAPLTLLAGRVLCVHPSSRIARENLEVFCDTWATNVNDLARMSKELDAACSGRLAAEKQAYMSLPRPGRHGTTSKPTKPLTLDVEDQQKIAKVGLEMKLLTAEVEAEAEKWDEYAENDIVKRAKAMSAMSYNMYLFTKGDGPLKTTHDLFTQAEFFAEQANKMHKTVTEFAFEVPGSAEKNELLQILDKIPFHCQQLQVLVKSPTVGKSATFSKVDAVISETKSLMNEIAKLVTACFVCATKFEIEFRGTVGPRSAIGDDDLGRGYSSQRASRESSAVWRRTPSMRRRAGNTNF